MIVSFYDKDFKGLQNNASLAVDNASFKLTKRAVDLDSLSCKCEAFTENIQPTFVVIRTDKGSVVYGALAGIPKTDKENQTEITGTDLKAMFKSDIYVDGDFSSCSDVYSLLDAIFDLWKYQVNKNTISCRIEYDPSVYDIQFGYLKQEAFSKRGVYNCWEDCFAPLLKYYGIYMTSKIDLVNKEIVFKVGNSFLKTSSIKLWELGKYDYGKHITEINETQAILHNTDTNETDEGYTWVLTLGSNANEVITSPGATGFVRNIFPIKRKVVYKEYTNSDDQVEIFNQANADALIMLANALYNENLDVDGIDADFDTAFNIIVKRGESVYKKLPVGELTYNYSGLVKVKIGYRITGLQFLL